MVAVRGQHLSGFNEPNVMALASTHDGTVYAGTELSAIYRSIDYGETWYPLHTLMALPSAKTWSFPPRPQAHHVQSILPDLARPARLHVAIEAGALVRSDDDGATWCDRVSSSPKDILRIPRDCTPLRVTAISRAWMTGIPGGE
jgi:hypothetical protein